MLAKATADSSKEPRYAPCSQPRAPNATRQPPGRLLGTEHVFVVVVVAILGTPGTRSALPTAGLS
jgi:hypothetical protein